MDEKEQKHKEVAEKAAETERNGDYEKAARYCLPNLTGATHAHNFAKEWRLDHLQENKNDRERTTNSENQ